MPLPVGRWKVVGLTALAVGLVAAGLAQGGVSFRRHSLGVLPILGPGAPETRAETAAPDGGAAAPDGTGESPAPGAPGGSEGPAGSGGPGKTAPQAPPRPGQATDLIPALNRWLQAGGRPEDLPALAAAWQAWAPEDRLVPAPLDGGGASEYLLPLRWAEPDPTGLRPGYLVAVLPSGSGWRAEAVPVAGTSASAAPGPASAPGGEAVPPPVLDPGLVGTADLDGDGRAEVVARSQTCGAHTCFLTVSVLRRGPTGWQTLLTVPEVPGGQVTLAGPEIQVTAAGVGSVGAGPQRAETWVYRWDGHTLALASHTVAPSRYAHFRLVDGEAATAAGDLARARQLYQEVLTAGDRLEYWSDPALEAPFLRALARFRLLVLAAREGRSAEVAALAEAAAREDGPYARWSMAFLAAAGPGGVNWQAGCQAAAAAWGLSPNDPPAYWGYSHDPFGPQSLCAGLGIGP